jgi:hypothetical protein
MFNDIKQPHLEVVIVKHISKKMLKKREVATNLGKHS